MKYSGPGAGTHLRTLTPRKLGDLSAPVTLCGSPLAEWTTDDLSVVTCDGCKAACLSTPAPVIRKVEDLAANKIATWLEEKAERILRENKGTGRGEHGAEILRLLAESIRQGEWRLPA